VPVHERGKCLMCGFWEHSPNDSQSCGADVVAATTKSAHIIANHTFAFVEDCEAQSHLCICLHAVDAPHHCKLVLCMCPHAEWISAPSPHRPTLHAMPQI
jgi:hypothetical protein